MPTPSEKRKRLRELIEQPGIVRSFGAHDVFTALILEKTGIETIFVGGFGTAASLFGLPDLNLLTMTEMADQVRRMSNRLNVPLIADGDTGYGEIQNVARTVETFEQAGAAGIILEDQVAPKRCGHFGGKSVIPTQDMRLKIRAAVSARTDPNFIIIARTDAREPNGLEDALCRVNLYCDSGADVAFIEAPQSRQELELIPTRVHAPLLANMLLGGKTPILSVQELEQLDYKIAVSPIETLTATAVTIQTLGTTFQTEGRLDALQNQMVSFDEVKQILGVEHWLKMGERL